MRPRIAVVGSGPAGLAFARVMHRHDRPVTVLERDPAPDARPPGGTLDLHEGLGQLALDKAGLLADFQALSRPSRESGDAGRRRTRRVDRHRPRRVDEAVRAFEERMWARAGTWAEITTAGLERLVSQNPAEALAHFDGVQAS
ncbi:hypothetical protein GCM10023323_17630 [Streptomyces thinghirensis]|uniref:FAD-dependent oxidoreductase n=1 Tax=Streptomyces thinghirensis TaxID=551547 RepID=A0ABP9T280_9ACTN